MAMYRNLALFLLGASVALCNLNGGAFGDKYDWVEWSQAKTLAATQGKPIMVLFHKTWCGACKRLAPLFSDNQELLKLSSKFVMVNAEDDEEPASDTSFSIDGGYIPRIVFVDQAGIIHPEFSNLARGEKYRYFYPSPNEIVNIMNHVLKNLDSDKMEL